MLNNPIYEFEKMREIFDSLFSRNAGSEYRNEGLELSNLYENQNGYMLQFIAPGVKQEDIAVDFANGLLSTHIKRNSLKPDDWTVLRRERASLDFTRCFRVSEDADIEHIDAKIVNGLLMVYIPRKEQAKPKKIEIKVH